MTEGSYTGEACSNCGRNRIQIRWDFWALHERRICEKCDWDQDIGVYVSGECFDPVLNAPQVKDKSTSGLRTTDISATFNNELGNRIVVRIRDYAPDLLMISMEGPRSLTENEVTPFEAERLHALLGVFLEKSEARLPAKAAREGGENV